MCDYSFKMLIIGDVGVGKSSLFLRFVDDIFIYEYCPSKRTQFKYSQIEMDGKQVLLQIWDAPGKRRLWALRENYYRNYHAVIIVYDSTSAESFRNVGNWIKDVQVFCSKEVSILLVGTKCDVMSKRQVSEEEAYQYADQHGLALVETSARMEINIRSAFYTIAWEIYNTQVFKEDTGDALQNWQVKVKKGQVHGPRLILDLVLQPPKRLKVENYGDRQGEQMQEDKD